MTLSISPTLFYTHLCIPQVPKLPLVFLPAFSRCLFCQPFHSPQRSALVQLKHCRLYPSFPADPTLALVSTFSDSHVYLSSTLSAPFCLCYPLSFGAPVSKDLLWSLDSSNSSLHNSCIKKYWVLSLSNEKPSQELLPESFPDPECLEGHSAHSPSCVLHCTFSSYQPVSMSHLPF